MSKLPRALIGTFALLASLAPAAHAAGLACQQDCSSGACLQSTCALPAAGSGFCDCSSGSLPWGNGTFAAFCRAWGQPGPGCLAAAQGQTGDALPAPASQLPNAAAMTAALASQNPFVATLLLAMQQGSGGWVGGPVQGLFHDSHFDATTAGLSHTAAVAFTGQVTITGAGLAQVDVTLTGDLTRFAWLTQYSGSLATGAVAPQEIHGTVSDGGLHGSLLVSGAGGRSQTIQW